MQYKILSLLILFITTSTNNNAMDNDVLVDSVLPIEYSLPEFNCNPIKYSIILTDAKVPKNEFKSILSGKIDATTLEMITKGFNHLDLNRITDPQEAIRELSQFIIKIFFEHYLLYNVTESGYKAHCLNGCQQTTSCKNGSQFKKLVNAEIYLNAPILFCTLAHIYHNSDIKEHFQLFQDSRFESAYRSYTTDKNCIFSPKKLNSSNIMLSPMIRIKPLKNLVQLGLIKLSTSNVNPIEDYTIQVGIAQSLSFEDYLLSSQYNLEQGIQHLDDENQKLVKNYVIRFFILKYYFKDDLPNMVNCTKKEWKKLTEKLAKKYEQALNSFPKNGYIRTALKRWFEDPNKIK